MASLGFPQTAGLALRARAPRGPSGPGSIRFPQHHYEHVRSVRSSSQSIRSWAKARLAGSSRTRRSGWLARSRQLQPVEQLGTGKRPEGAEAGSELPSTAPSIEDWTLAPDAGMSRPLCT